MVWDKNRAFLKQLLIDISRVRKEGHLRMWSYTSGNEGVVVVEDFHPEVSFLEVRATVSGPRDRNETIPLKQIGPRRYQATVPLWGKGRYQVIAVGVSGDRSDQAIGGFIVPYSPEYLRFRSNPIVLNEISERTEGMNLSDLDDNTQRAEIIFGRRDPKKSSRPVFDWFLIALACCIPLDVAFRRIQIDFSAIKSRLGLGPQRYESTETMGALLERKQAVESELNAQREEHPLIVSQPLVSRRQRPIQPARPQQDEIESPREVKETQPQKSADQDDAEMSTTERLLAMKRKREDEDS